MIDVLADHNIEGQAWLIWSRLHADGWSQILPAQLLTFEQAGLAVNANDRDVWRFAQKERMILLTANRRMREKNSLEKTLRDENFPAALPVLTIGNADKVFDRKYCEECALRIVEMCSDINAYLGTGRLFIP